MTEHPHHESLRLQNFTAFEDASFEFVPGINVFIGENGTGKPHAMKAMYAWQLQQHRKQIMPSKVAQIFQVETLQDLSRDRSRLAEVESRLGAIRWEFMPGPSGIHGHWDFPSSEAPSRPVFIPALDMMGHTKGFLSTYDLYEIDFDLTQRDVVSLLLAPELREMSERQKSLAASLEKPLKGELELEGERFYLRTERGRLPMPAVAEGLRKIATLLRLIQGGWLRPGSTLFWDEPEVNLNPILMDEVVSALLALALNGVQIFLATHSYVILKELDLQAQEGEVRYFAFKPGKGGTTVSHSADFGTLEPNAILDQYDRMMIRDMQRADREAEASRPR